MAEKNALIRDGSSRSGALSSVDSYTCANAEPPSRFLPNPRSIRIKLVSPRSVRSCGVSVFRASAVGAKAETTNEIGAVTDFLLSPILPYCLHRHRIFANRYAYTQFRAKFHADRMHRIVKC